jgi:hypothetical protein
MRVFQFRGTQRRYKARYQVKNWPSYASGLRRRGSVTLWIGRDAARTWYHVGRRRPGGKRVYSDAAIRRLEHRDGVSAAAAAEPEALVSSLTSYVETWHRQPW